MAFTLSLADSSMTTMMSQHKTWIQPRNDFNPLKNEKEKLKKTKATQRKRKNFPQKEKEKERKKAKYLNISAAFSQELRTDPG